MSERFAKLPRGIQDRLLAASEWHRRIAAEPRLELSGEFLRWMDDPGHRAEYEAVTEAFSALDDLSTAPEFLALRRASLASAERAGTRPRKPYPAFYRIAAVFVVTAGLGSALAYAYLQSGTGYQTNVGERRAIGLPDGSRVSLDSDSEVSIKYTDGARLVDLERGRARFDVAHDPSRPFSVRAGSETVVAVGTSFDVERIGSKVLVTLIQGHVVIKNDADRPVTQTASSRKPKTVSLAAGQQLVAAADAPPKIAPANIQSATAWETGHLIFVDVPLSEAVARVNRYTAHPIAVDAEVAAIRVSGIFNAGDVGSFVNAVTSYFPIQASTDGNEIITLQRKS